MNFFKKDEFSKKESLYSLIIPTYNERENIGILVYLIFKHLNEQ
jgi:dolichol-phosphate mannosyltransferase